MLGSVISPAPGSALGSDSPPVLAPASSPVDSGNQGEAGGRVPSLPPLPAPLTIGALRASVVAAVLDDDQAALTAFARHSLSVQRKRSRKLWLKLGELLNSPDLGAGARGSPASALGALATAHARLVSADRLILGLEAGQVVPASADDTPRPVLGLVATATDAEWRRLARAHTDGSTIASRAADDGDGQQAGPASPADPESPAGAGRRPS